MHRPEEEVMDGSLCPLFHVAAVHSLDQLLTLFLGIVCETILVIFCLFKTCSAMKRCTGFVGS